MASPTRRPPRLACTRRRAPDRSACHPGAITTTGRQSSPTGGAATAAAAGGGEGVLVRCFIVMRAGASALLGASVDCTGALYGGEEATANGWRRSASAPGLAPTGCGHGSSRERRCRRVGGGPGEAAGGSQPAPPTAVAAASRARVICVEKPVGKPVGAMTTTGPMGRGWPVCRPAARVRAKALQSPHGYLHPWEGGRLARRRRRAVTTPPAPSPPKMKRDGTILILHGKKAAPQKSRSTRSPPAPT